MAEKTFRLEIVTPERTVFSDDVISLTVPAHSGYLGVLAGHAPLLCTLTTGEIRTRPHYGHVHLAISGGFMEVTPAKVIILADSAERVEEIDVTRVERARDHALKQLAERLKGDDLAHAQADLARALNRLEVVQKYGALAKK